MYSTYYEMQVVDLLREARAGRIAILDVAGRCSWADTMVVATCRSRRHVHATGAAVMHEVRHVQCFAMSGSTCCDWPARPSNAVISGGSEVHAFRVQVKQRVREVAPGVKSALDGAPDSDWVVVDAGVHDILV